MGIETTDAATAGSSRAVVASAPTGDGVRVDSVAAGSPAALAGLEPGDIITGIDGSPVHSNAELRSQLYPDPPGADLAISIQRGSSSATIPVVLADSDGDAPGDASSP